MSQKPIQFATPLDELAANIPHVTDSEQPWGHVRRSLECILDHLKGERADANELIRKIGLDFNDYLKLAQAMSGIVNQPIETASAWREGSDAKPEERFYAVTHHRKYGLGMAMWDGSKWWACDSESAGGTVDAPRRFLVIPPPPAEVSP